nr:putative ribonuclease H-like domain-containing protein [Tanacetum cinerariifolium]
FYGMKGIKRGFSVARAPQQNKVTERKNRTLIEAAKTMLANSLLPIPFWAKAVNTACYVQNRETLHINFLENQPNVVGSRPTWLFDINTLTQSMNYQPVVAGNQPNSSAGIQEHLDAGKVGKDSVFSQQYVLLPLWSTGLKDHLNTNSDAAFNDKENESKVYVSTSSSDKPKKHDEKEKRVAKGKNPVDFAPVTAVELNLTNNTNSFNAVGSSTTAVSLNFNIGGKSLLVDPSQNLDDPNMPALEEIIYSNDEANVFRNKKDERGIVVRNKARLVTHGHTKEEGIDYEEVFALVARIEAIQLFLDYASFMGFMVYQIDVKSAFLYGTIEEEFYVCQPLGFKDSDYPDKVYKVVKALYRLHQAPKDWYETLANYLLENGFKRGKIDQVLFIKKQKVKQKDEGIFISQDKYVAEILRKFGLTDGKSASTPIDTEKPLLKDPNGKDMDTVVTTSSTEAEYVAAKFWTFVSIKKSNDVVRLHALIDRKKVIIIEDIIRQALRLDDVARVDCVPNDEIFDELAKMGYEKPSTKLTFYKAFFSAQWKRLEKKRQFKSLGLKRLRKVITAQRVKSSTDTVMDDQEDASKQEGISELDADEDVTLVNAEEDMSANVQGRLAKSQAKVYHLDLQHAKKVLSMQDTNETEPAKVEEVIKVVTAAKLMTKVVTTTATTITATQVPKASAPRKRRGVVIQDPEETTTASVIVHTKDEDFARELEAKINFIINLDDVMEQVKTREKQDNTVMRYQYLKREPVTEAQARKNMMIYLKNMAGFKMDFFKGMTYNDIRHIFEKHYNSIKAFMEKREKKIKEEGNKRKGNSLNQDATKKQRIDEETEEPVTHLQIVANDDDVYTEATPLALKVPVGDYQIHNENNKPYYKIIRADRTYQLFLSFITLLEVKEESEMSLKLLSMHNTDEAEPAEVEEVIKVVTAAKLIKDVVTTTPTTITASQVPKASAPRRMRGVIIQDPEEIATASVIVHSEAKSKDKGKGILIEEPKPLKRQAQIEQDEAFVRELEVEFNANINWNDVMEQVKRKEKQDNTVMRYQALKRKPVEKKYPLTRFTLEHMLNNVRLKVEEESKMSLELLRLMALNNAQTKSNSLTFRSMLEKHQLTRPNFNEWFCALKLVVRTEKLQNVFETALPPVPAAGADAQALAD